MADSAAILGEFNVYGDSGAVSALAEHLHSRAHVVHLIKGDLLKGSGAHDWKGGAAEAFKGALGELPKELDQLFDSYGKAGRVLKAYAHQLHAHKLKAHQLANKIQRARDVIKTATADLNAAQLKYDGAKGLHDLSTVDSFSKHQAAQDMAHASTAMTAASAKLSDSTGVISAALYEAATNRAEFVTAAKRCCKDMDAAGKLGIQNIHRHGVDAALHNLASVVSAILDGLGDLAAELSDLLDFGVILAGLLVVAAGIATIATDGAASPLLAASLDILSGVTTANIAADVAAVAAGKRPKSILIEDAIGLIGGKATSKLVDKAFPAGTYDEVKNALQNAADHETGHNQQYAAHLLNVFKGNVAAGTAARGAKISYALKKKLEKILAGCSSHSGSVPAHG